MKLTYRGVEYTTDEKGGSDVAKTLKYRGNAYPSIKPMGSCKRVTFHEVYRGVKHDEVKSVCV